MLEREGNAEFLCEQVGVVLVWLNLAASSDADILNLVLDLDELWQVDLDLSYDVFLLEIIEGQPVFLVVEVSIVIANDLTEEKWSLGAAIILEPDSFVVEPPVLVILDHGFFSVIRRGAR